MAVVSRATFLSAVDPADWSMRLFGTTYTVAITFDDFVRALLLDEVIDITPAILARLEHSLKDRPKTLTNLRRLAA